MKNLLMLCLLLAAFAVNAQDSKPDKNEARLEKRELMKNFSPEQKAELRTKRLTLKLNLSDEQQTKVNALFLAQAKGKNVDKTQDAQKAITPEELFETQSKNLDRRIEFDRKIKTILDETQYAKWKEINKNSRQHRGQKHRKTQHG